MRTLWNGKRSRSTSSHPAPSAAMQPSITRGRFVGSTATPQRVAMSSTSPAHVPRPGGGQTRTDECDRLAPLDDRPGVVRCHLDTPVTCSCRAKAMGSRSRPRMCGAGRRNASSPSDRMTSSGLSPKRDTLPSNRSLVNRGIQSACQARIPQVLRACAACRDGGLPQSVAGPEEETFCSWFDRAQHRRQQRSATVDLVTVVHDLVA